MMAQYKPDYFLVAVETKNGEIRRFVVQSKPGQFISETFLMGYLSSKYQKYGVKELCPALDNVQKYIDKFGVKFLTPQQYETGKKYYKQAFMSTKGHLLGKIIK